MRENVCKFLKCPYFSEGIKNRATGAIGGYGCRKYSTAYLCPVNSIKRVEATEYELGWDSEKVAPIHKESAAVVYDNFVPQPLGRRY